MVLGVVFAVEGRITLGEFIAFLSYNASPPLGRCEAWAESSPI